MFSNLRVNAPLYILHKEAMPFYIESGSVINVSAPMPSANYMGGQMTFTVDVVAMVNGQRVTYSKLPANAESADFAGNGNIVVASTRDAINAELTATRQRSIDELARTEYNNSVVSICDKLYQQINPEVAEKAKQAEEMDAIKSEMAELRKMNKELMTLLKEKTSSSKKEDL